MTLAAFSTTVEKIATVLPITDELFEDSSAMRVYIEARMGLFLQFDEIERDARAAYPARPLLMRAFMRGATAAIMDEGIDSNPYERTTFSIAWLQGYARRR